jgi:Reverse transcriptase (RNA-dependent DNA polymerase)
MNFWDTILPVIWWAMVRIVLILILIFGWATLQIDFILAYPQAKVECDLYMKIPKGFKFGRGTNRMHVLKLLQSLYGQRQAGCVWNKHLHKLLIELA